MMLAFQTQLQTAIYGKFNPSEMTYDEKVNMTKQYVLYAHEELAEVMQALKYKTYHKYEKEYKEEDVRTEIIDCFKFVLNLGILWDMGADDFENVFRIKSEENLKRLSGNNNEK